MTHTFILKFSNISNEIEHIGLFSVINHNHLIGGYKYLNSFNKNLIHFNNKSNDCLAKQSKRAYSNKITKLNVIQNQRNETFTSQNYYHTNLIQRANEQLKKDQEISNSSQSQSQSQSESQSEFQLRNDLSSEKKNLDSQSSIDNETIHGNKPYFHLLQRAKARMFVEEQNELRRIGMGDSISTSTNQKEKTPEEEEAEFEKKIELILKEDEANALLNSPIRRPNIQYSQKEFTMKRELFRRPGEEIFMLQLVFLFFFLILAVALLHQMRKTLIPIWRYSVHEDVMWMEDLRDFGGIIIAMPGYGQDLYIFPENDIEKYYLQKVMGEESYQERAAMRQRL